MLNLRIFLLDGRKGLKLRRRRLDGGLNYLRRRRRPPEPVDESGCGQDANQKGEEETAHRPGEAATPAAS